MRVTPIRAGFMSTREESDSQGEEIHESQDSQPQPQPTSESNIVGWVLTCPLLTFLHQSILLFCTRERALV